MRIGCCVGLGQIETARNAGYDFVELSVALLKAQSPSRDYEPVRQAILDSGITPEAWNCLLPAELKVVGQEVDLHRVERYLHNAFERIEELGGEIVVFGSGKARAVPDGFGHDAARDQLLRFLAIAGQIAEAHGLVIVVEPLNRGECNIINSVKEAAELGKAVDHPSVSVLVDLYHMTQENEPISAIASASDRIRHVHLADTDRLYPGSGGYPIGQFIETLKTSGYDQRLSIECSWNDFGSECSKSLAFLRPMASS